MRQWMGWTQAALIAVGTAGCAHARPGAVGDHSYPARDRHALVVLFPVGSQCKVIAGPETHIGFPGKKVVWRVVNLCGRGVDLEFQIYKRVPESAPETPFVEGKEFAPRVAPGFGAENTFERTVRRAGDFPLVGHHAVENQYFYWIGVKGDAASRMEPELDIWP